MTEEVSAPPNAGLRPRIVDRAVLPALSALALVALVIGPRNGAALTGLLAALAMATVLGLVRTGPAMHSRSSMALLVTSGLTVLWLVVRAAFAVTPRVSMLGAVGQHTGVALWIAIFGVFTLLTMFPRDGDLLTIVRIVSVIGAVAGLVAMMDAAGVTQSLRFSGEVSGLMESSSSLGQVALAGLGAGIAWAVAARRPDQRLSAVACTAASAAGLVLAQSRAAWVALVVAIVVVAVARTVVRASRWTSGGVAIAVMALVLACLAATVWVSVAAPGELFDDFARISNERVVIWRSAVTQAGDSPVTGYGPEQFSAWVTWSTDPGVSIQKTGAYDPHNLLLYMLLAGGVPGLVGTLAILFLASRHMFALLPSAGLGVSALVFVETAVFASMMFAWTSPLAVLLAVLILGALVSTGEQRRHEEASAGAVARPSVLGPTLRYGIALACAVAVGALAPGIAAEYSWARALDDGRTTPEILMETAEATGDPSMYAAAAVEYPAETYPVLQAAARWHVDAAFELNQAEYVALARGAGSWERVAETVESGLDSDPTSGMWDYLAATEADLLGFEDEASDYATRALRYRLPDNARTWLEGLRDADDS